MAIVKVDDFTRDMQVETIYSADKTELEIVSSNINRPGLQLSGFFDYFAADRIQVLGKVEMTYLEEAMDSEQRVKMLSKLFSYPIPCVIISRNQNILPEIVETAKKYECPVYRSNLVTTKLVHSAITYLDDLLAPRITRHGVLLDINGVGLLLMGESGIGKSETALELVKRGHRLVADDAVEICRTSQHQLMGEAPTAVRHFMEIRGVGIIDVRQMYGVGSVIHKKSIDIVIEMEAWDPEKVYDRLGISDDYATILGVKLPRITIPVRPGRNLAIIIEVASRNFRLKAMGYNAAIALTEQLMKDSD